VVTAWDETADAKTLVGISRSMTDFRYVTYLADLAVRASYQRMGIGVELIRQTHQAAPEAYIVLLAAPKAVDYYPRIGFTRHESAWVLRPGEELLSRGESC
jgi:predicted N-acetyltransferase YhbS